MAQVCTVCSHPERDAIDTAILDRRSNRSIASQFGVSIGAVQRHKDNHIPEHLSKAREAEEIAQADTLIGDLQHLKDTALSLLAQAEQIQDLRAASSLIGQARQVIETLAEVRGELDRKASINIFINPQFQQIQKIILQELNAYPDVREKIVDRLTEVNQC